MLPDSLIELFDVTGSDDFPTCGARDPQLAKLVHATVSQTALLNSVTVRYARENDLNHIDFQVLIAVVTNANEGITVTPGYISETLALSASTLTSILERLADHGLIVRDKDLADKRRIALYYTEKAAQLVVNYYRYIGTSFGEFFAEKRSEVPTVISGLEAAGNATDHLLVSHQAR